MSQNTILGEPEDPAVVARLAQRAMARREAGYADEVRRLLDAGLEVMRRSGTTSSPRVADIVRAAGLSNDAFYRHFAGKEELVTAILEAGAERLVGYLGHQMAKATTPEDRLRRWVEGVMAQAADPEVAESTRAVLWNGSRVGDASRADTSATYAPLAVLLHEPLAALANRDPERDAAVIVQAVMGRMQDFLWRRVQPTPGDVDHLAAFVLAAVTHSSRISQK
jgi:AcrR family transcriptional regulator